MFPCCLCHKTFLGQNDVLRHMRLFHAFPSDGFACKFAACGRTYDSLGSFGRHLKTCHQNAGDFVQPPHGQNPLPAFQMNVNVNPDIAGVVYNNENVDDIDDVEDQQAEVEEVVTPDSVLRCVAKSALTFVSELYSINNINRANVDLIVKHTSHLVNSIVGSIRSKFQDFDDPAIGEIFDVTANSFEGLLTESQRFTALQSCGFLLQSESIDIDYAQDVVNNAEPNLAQIPLSGQFVPLRDVLKQFFEMPNVLDLTLENYENLMAEDNEISNIVQGSLWRNIASRYEGKTVLPLNVSYDDFEPDNLAGSHQGDHKIGGTYFNCPVLPQKFLGCLKNMFVAQLILSDDRNVVDGNHKAFHKLIKELKFLEEEGILISVNNVCRRVYFTLTLL